MKYQHTAETIRIRRLIRLLGSKDGATRLTAEHELLEVLPRREKLVISELEREVHNRRRLPHVVAGAIVAQLASFWALHAWIPHLRLSTFVGTAVSLSFLSLAAMATTRNAAARVLAGLRDVRAVGPLAIAYGQVNHETRPEVAAALLRLLPRMTEEQVRRLSPAQLRALQQCLPGSGREMVLAILKVLMLARDCTAIPAVESLDRGQSAATEQTLRRKTKECLAYLRDWEEFERASTVLLRPVSPDSNPDALVRPATDLRHSAAELLRTCCTR